MDKWNETSVRELLLEKGWYESERKIQEAIQFSLTDKTTKINCFHTGKVVVQGKNTLLQRGARVVFGGPPASHAAARSGATSASPQHLENPNRVFIVYGHDTKAREQLELLLRRLNTTPVVLANIPSGGDTIIEKLEALTAADYACVLVTPDDEGRERAKTEKEEVSLKPRARQNVVLELGMVLARLGRRRVAILIKTNGIEKPSDIDGLLYIGFSNHVSEAKNDLAANLQQAGFTIDIKGLVDHP